MHSRQRETEIKPHMNSATRRRYRIATLAALALCIGGLGFAAWNGKLRADERWRENMDLESFNATQMEVWRWCWSISGMLEKVSDKVGDAMTHEEKTWATAAFTPAVCAHLQKLREQTRRERIEREATQPTRPTPR